ncbi:MAG TPA: site-2 protease family protein [Polyangiaceae bacterium]|nr:site-2 protease family protein [Polyangiaceae bacterium]
MHGSYSDIGRRLVLYLVTMLLSLTVHEFAHAFVAVRLGDETPRRDGRLTLSPLAHYDVWGTFLIPIISVVISGVALIGWARPVETNPGNYTRRLSMRNGHRLVASAGPLSNLLLAVLCMGGLTLFVKTGSIGDGAGTGGAFALLLVAMVKVNLALCVLNLLPLPPLDGARLLPRSLDGFQAAIAPYSFFIVLVVLNFPGLSRVLFWPVGVLGALLQALFGLDVGLA